MTGSPTAMAASDAIVERKEELARAITEALYAEHPALLARHGEEGRTKCLQDMRYNLEHLAPAVALEDPALFGRYVQWLTQMLGARGVASGDVRRCIEATEAVLLARFPADQAAATRASLRAGVVAVTDATAR